MCADLFRPSTSSGSGANPGIDIIKEIFRRQKPARREMRFLGPFEHPGALPRCSLRPAWWKWRKVFGSVWKHLGEHINVWELRAGINGVLWRLRSASNIHSKGSPCSGFNGDLGSFGKRAFRIAAPRATGHEVRFAYGRSIFHTPSLSPFLVYCRTDLNPADGPSRQG